MQGPQRTRCESVVSVRFYSLVSPWLWLGLARHFYCRCLFLDLPLRLTTAIGGREDINPTITDSEYLRREIESSTVGRGDSPNRRGRLRSTAPKIGRAPCRERV